MKTPSDQIWQLIESLTKSEKRYFKIYAERHVLGEKNNYLKLFEIIEKQDKYDEEPIRKYFKNEKFESYFPVAKQYLFQMILDSLHAYEQNTNQDQLIKKSIHHAEILLNKGLIKSATKILKKTKMEAAQQEKFILVAEALELEKKIIAKKYYKDISSEDLDKLAKEVGTNISQMQNLNDYWHLSARLFSLHFKKGISRNKDELKMLEDIYSDSLLQNIEEAKSYRAQLDFFQIKAAYHFIKNEEHQAYHFNKKYLNLFEKYPSRIKEHPGRYLSSLNNFLIDSLSLGKYDDLKSGVEKMRQIPKKGYFKQSESAEADIFRLSYMLELNMYVSLGEFKKGAEVARAVESGLGKYKDQIIKPNIISFYYLLAYIQFGNNNYDGSIGWLNKIINDTDEKVSQDIYAFARIMSLIVHYELNNLELLEYLIKSTYRYLKKRKKLFAVEKEFLKFIKKINYANFYDKEVIRSQFKKLKDDLQPLLQDPYEQKAFDYFDFISWLESKIEGKTFMEKKQEKNRATA